MARTELPHGIILPAEYSDDWYDDMTSNLSKLDEVIGSDANKLSDEDVGAAALSNDYTDLDNKPALKPVATSGDYDDLDNKPDLKPVATSGDYDDLTNKPSYGILRMTSETLTDSGSGAISNLNSDSKLAAGDYVLDAALKVFPIAAVSAPNYTVGTSLFQITNASALAAVATSGSYDDLNNLPAYGITRFVNAAISDNSNVAFANISSVDKIKAGDFLLDIAGKMYLIASIDSVNETAAVTTPLTQLAVDSSVIHNTGNETVNGTKDFTGTLRVYNSDSSANTAQLWLKNSKVNRGQNVYGDQSIWFRDATDKPVTAVISRVSSSGASVLVLCAYNVDQNNQQVSNYLSFAKNLDGSCYLVPDQNDVIVLGSSAAKFKSIHTNLINGLTPSSLGMPVAPSSTSYVDISGYIDLDNSGANLYTPLANGYITFDVTGSIVQILNDNGIQYKSSIASGSTNCGYCIVNAGVQYKIYVSASAINKFWFIPCQGNV